MARIRSQGIVRRIAVGPRDVWRRRPAAGAGAEAWGRLSRELLRNVATGIAFTSADAHAYCVGTGIEIGGAASNPFDLNTRNVDMTDSMESVFKAHELAECGAVMPVDIVAPGDKLPLPDASEDFIVSSHVLEHFPDPVRALLEWDRVVRPGGVIFMIVPHKERTFEADLPRTTLAHLIDDYEHGTVAAEGEAGMHFHVWVTEDVVELCEWMRERFGLAWAIVHVRDRDDKVGNGFTIVIRKGSAGAA